MDGAARLPECWLSMQCFVPVGRGRGCCLAGGTAASSLGHVRPRTCWLRLLELLLLAPALTSSAPSQLVYGLGGSTGSWLLVLAMAGSHCTSWKCSHTDMVLALVSSLALPFPKLNLQMALVPPVFWLPRGRRRMEKLLDLSISPGSSSPLQCMLTIIWTHPRKASRLLTNFRRLRPVVKGPTSALNPGVKARIGISDAAESTMTATSPPDAILLTCSWSSSLNSNASSLLCSGCMCLLASRMPMRWRSLVLSVWRVWKTKTSTLMLLPMPSRIRRRMTSGRICLNDTWRMHSKKEARSASMMRSKKLVPWSDTLAPRSKNPANSRALCLSSSSSSSSVTTSQMIVKSPSMALLSSMPLQISVAARASIVPAKMLKRRAQKHSSAMRRPKPGQESEGHSCCARNQHAGASRTAFQMEALVQCIRAALSNPAASRASSAWRAASNPSDPKGMNCREVHTMAAANQNSRVATVNSFGKQCGTRRSWQCTKARASCRTTSPSIMLSMMSTTSGRCSRTSTPLKQRYWDSCQACNLARTFAWAGSFCPTLSRHSRHHARGERNPMHGSPPSVLVPLPSAALRRRRANTLHDVVRAARTRIPRVMASSM
mmetsp:Transcript_102087/g.284210  ORF Transcript_102087/g.284210 Transcript_102087/m.284210 type:complete len:604 (+) Transcript_102087:116-1927(+)